MREWNDIYLSIYLYIDRCVRERERERERKRERSACARKSI